MGLCWLPFGLAPLMPLGPAVVIAGMRGVRSGRTALWGGFLFGVARYAVASHFLLWLGAHSPLGFVFYPLAIAYIVPWAMLEVGAAYHLRERAGVPAPLTLGVAYAVLEAARTAGGNSSFPADLLTHAFGTNPAWLSWSAWIGPFGLTFFIWCVGWLLERAFRRLREGAAPRAAVLAGLALFLWALPPLTDRALHPRDPPGEAGAMRVALVQPFVQVSHKLDRSRWPELWSRLTSLSTEAARRGADLVVWPETTRPGAILWRGDTPIRDGEMQALSDRLGVPILYGAEIARLDDEGGIVGLFNGAGLVHPHAPASFQWYGKQRLLPFAEGVPFAKWIGFDPVSRYKKRKKRTQLSLLGNFMPGPDPEPFRTGAARIGVFICYEGMYPVLGRDYRNKGVNSLFVLTNDAWWGHSVFPGWHARMVASRARELDVPVVRAANNGFSSLTNRHGRIESRSKLDEITVHDVALRPGNSPPTLFARYGGFVPWVLLATLPVVAIAGSLRRRRSHAAETRR